MGEPELRRIWDGMLDRCAMRESHGAENYAGRGIRVCLGWRTSFEQFVADMGPRPSGDHSVDRIANDGHYSCGHCSECKSRNWPANCRWATRKEQAQNRRPPRKRRTGTESFILAGVDNK